MGADGRVQACRWQGTGVQTVGYRRADSGVQVCRQQGAGVQMVVGYRRADGRVQMAGYRCADSGYRCADSGVQACRWWGTGVQTVGYRHADSGVQACRWRGTGMKMVTISRIRAASAPSQVWEAKNDCLVGGQGRVLDIERWEDFDSCECTRRARRA